MADEPAAQPVAPAAAPAAQPAQRKSPVLAVVLSFFICGLGQIYNGQVMKGLMFLLLYILLWVVAGFLVIAVVGFCLFPLPLLLWLYGLYDAYTVAEKINRGESP